MAQARLETTPGVDGGGTLIAFPAGVPPCTPDVPPHLAAAPDGAPRGRVRP